MARPWEAHLTIEDNKGKKGHMTIYVQYYDPYVPANSDWDSAEGVLLYLMEQIDALINGAITRCYISRKVPIPLGLKTMANAKADVEEKGVFTFFGDGKYTMEIPTFRDDLVISGSNQIDREDADVASLLFAISDGSGTPLDFVRLSDNRDDNVVVIESAYERFEKSGKRRT